MEVSVFASLEQLQTTSALYLQGRQEEQEVAGWHGLIYGLTEGWRYIDMEDHHIPQEPTNYGNVLILGCHHSGKILFCYNDCCRGKDFYADTACARIKALSPSVRTMEKQPTLPLPLQTVQLRFDPSTVHQADEDQLMIKPHAEFGNVRVNIIARAQVDLTEDPNYTRYIAVMVKRHLGPISLSLLDYNPEKKYNIAAFWTRCDISNSIVLYDHRGCIELTITDNRFEMYLRSATPGFAIFIGINAHDSGFPQGKVLRWGEEGSYFAPVRTEDRHFYTNAPEARFDRKKRLDFGDNFRMGVADITEYTPRSIHTITDLLLLHSRFVPRHGPLPIEEAWFVKIVPQGLGKGWDSKKVEQQPLVIVRAYIHYRKSGILKNPDDSLGDKPGKVYHICNVICDGHIPGSAEDVYRAEVICQATESKHHIELCDLAKTQHHRIVYRDLLQKYMKKFTPIIEARMEALDKEFLIQQQSRTPQSKPRRTVISVTPSQMPYTPMHTESSSSVPPTPSRSTFNSEGLSSTGPRSEDSRSLAMQNGTSATPIMIEDDPFAIANNAITQPLPSRAVPLYDDDDALLLGLISQPPNATPPSSDETNQETRFRESQFSDYFRDSTDESTNEDEVPDTSNLETFNGYPDENAVPLAKSSRRKRARYEGECEDEEAADVNEEEIPEESSSSESRTTSSSSPDASEDDSEDNEGSNDENDNVTDKINDAEIHDEVEKFIFGIGAE